MGSGLSYFSFKRYEYLFDDDLFQDVIDSLDYAREDLVEWYRENDSDRVTCPVCGTKNIRYEWNTVCCNNCGWYKEEHVPHSQSSGVTNNRDLYTIFKTKFGNRLYQEKQSEKIDEEDLDFLPIELEDFDTGEYTEEQVKFLRKRFNDFLSLDDVEFSETDLTMIHYLILQELKVKKLYRIEAVEGKTDGDFALTKKRELDVLKSLKNEVKEIVNEQQKDEEESAYLEDIDKIDLNQLEKEYEEEKKERKSKIKESERRRKEGEGYFRDEMSHEK